MPPELARIIQEDYEVSQEERDAAPPADPTKDDDMSVEEVEDELYSLIFGLPAGD